MVLVLASRFFLPVLLFSRFCKTNIPNSSSIWIEEPHENQLELMWLALYSCYLSIRLCYLKKGTALALIQITVGPILLTKTEAYSSCTYVDHICSLYHVLKKGYPSCTYVDPILTGSPQAQTPIIPLGYHLFTSLLLYIL